MSNNHPTNAPMPPILYGTAWKKEKTADLVVKAIKHGFRGIDTACQPKHYNEAGVGEAIQRAFNEGLSRSELFIQTKFTPLSGQDPHNIPYDKKAQLHEQVAQSFDASKKNLGIAFVDSLILHSPLATLDQTMTAWHAMEQIHHQGATKQIGISNCYDLALLEQIYEQAKIKPTILQNRFYQETDYDHDLRQWCQKNNIVYQSFWTLTANPHILDHIAVQKAAQTLGKTPAQILFSVLSKMGIVPLTGTSSEKHMKEDLEAINLKLPLDITQEISLLFS